MSEMSPAQTPSPETSTPIRTDHNEQSEGDQAEPGDPDSASDPMPDIAGTGS